MYYIQWIVKRSDSKTKSSSAYSSIDTQTIRHVDIHTVNVVSTCSIQCIVEHVPVCNTGRMYVGCAWIQQ